MPAPGDPSQGDRTDTPVKDHATETDAFPTNYGGPFVRPADISGVSLAGRDRRGEHGAKRLTNLLVIACSFTCGAAPACASCDLADFIPVKGLSAAATANGVAVEWEGDASQKLQLQLSVDSSGKPRIDRLALWDQAWVPVIENAVPEFSVTTDLGERTLASGAPGLRLPDVVALKATGINIVSMVDSLVMGPIPAAPPPPPAPPPGSAAPASPLPVFRMSDPVAIITAADQAAAAQSDRDFAVWPNQEIYGSPFGGHTDVLFSHKVLWRNQAVPSAAEVAANVYELGSAADLQRHGHAVGDGPRWFRTAAV